MYYHRYVEYIQFGYNLATATMHRKKQFMTLCLSLLTIYPGVMMGGVCRFLSLSMVSCILASIVFVLIYSKTLTLKKHLILEIIGDSELVIVYLIIQIIFANVLNNPKAFLLVLLIFIPNIIIPVLIVLRFGIKNEKRKKKTNNFVPGVALGASFGGMGYIFAKKFLSDAGQSTAIVMVLIFFAILSYISSTGLIAIHKLYYYRILKKNGISFASL